MLTLLLSVNLAVFGVLFVAGLADNAPKKEETLIVIVLLLAIAQIAGIIWVNH